MTCNGLLDIVKKYSHLWIILAMLWALDTGDFMRQKNLPVTSIYRNENVMFGGVKFTVLLWHNHIQKQKDQHRL